MQTTRTKLASLPQQGNMEVDKSQSVRMPLLCRIYVWSIVLEPLLFFKLFDNAILGVTPNLSRILQIIVVFGLVVKLLALLLTPKRTDVRLPNLASPLYINYGIYLALLMLSGFIGLLSGAYYLSHAYYDDDPNASGFARLLSSQEIRPIFEYVITIYYFIYFAILPRYLLKTKKNVEYFFSVFKAFFIISLVAGFIDVALSAIGTPLIPRHIADWMMVGVRFHGLAGEPRDAFVYLFFGLAILYLHAHYKSLVLSRWWLAAIIAAAMLTQSASGLVGVMFFLVMYGIYSLGSLRINKVVQLSVLLTLVIALLYVATINSERLMMYLESASEVWNILEAGEKLPYLMFEQRQNIYPLYDWIVKVRDLNVVSVFIGSGLGSASIISNIYDTTTAGMNNPNSQFVRLIFESGLIGTYFFIMSFTYPVKRLTKYLPTKKRNIFMLLTLLLIGCFLGHRSAAAYIYLGIIIAVFSVLDPRAGRNINYNSDQ